MHAMDYWKLFLQTGAPDFYLKYHKALRMENEYASNDPGPGTSGHGLQ